MKAVHGGVTAGCFALSAFLVALAAGLSAGNPLNTILLRALLAMALCYPLGLLAGKLCGWVVEQHVAGRSAEDTSPDRPDDLVAGDRHLRSATPSEDMIDREGMPEGVLENEEALAVQR